MNFLSWLLLNVDDVHRSVLMNHFAVRLVLVIEGRDACASSSTVYVSQTHDQKRCAISVLAADWHELKVSIHLAYVVTKILVSEKDDRHALPQPCINSNSLSQWRMPKFDPL